MTDFSIWCESWLYLLKALTST